MQISIFCVNLNAAKEMKLQAANASDEKKKKKKKEVFVYAHFQSPATCSILIRVPAP